MINYILIYTLISFLLFLFNSKLSYKINLVDFPTKRKRHLKQVANTGGIIISICLLFSMKLFDVNSPELNLIFPIAFLISIVGFIDDRFELNIGGKLSLQIIPILYLLIYGNFSLESLGDYNNVAIELNTFAVPFSLLSIIFLINASNYFDGLDGTLGLTAISVILILFFLTSVDDNKLFLITLIIPIIIFLLFNFSTFNLPKLFLGDSGSLLIGFILAFKLIYLSNNEKIHSIILAWSISIFVFEFISLNLIRLKNKKKLFKAGQDHLHHQLFKYTRSIFQTNLLIFLGNIILFVVGYASFLLISPLASLILFMVFFIIFLILRNKYSS